MFFQERLKLMKRHPEYSGKPDPGKNIENRFYI